MNNVLDYLDWRGDIPFEIDPFNEVDALVLARLSYLDLHDLVDESFEEYAIQDVEKQYAETLDQRFIHYEQDVALFHKAAHSVRFKDVKITRYINHLEPDIFKQFAAVTFIIERRLAYLSFRGTDSTFAGWREDLNMTYEKVIPSQDEAADYLEKAINRHPFYQYYLGGHSKGGNLAIAALIMQPNRKHYDKVKAIFSFDGPGFRQEIIDTSNYHDALNKITNFVPQSSIVGKMLGHEENFIIIYSEATGTMQHDVYSWEVKVKAFNHQKTLTLSSHIIDKALDEYLVNLSDDKKAKLVDVIFDIVDASQTTSTRDFKKNLLKATASVTTKMMDLSEADKQLIGEAISVLTDALVESAGEELGQYAKTKKDHLIQEATKEIDEYVKNKKDNVKYKL